MKVAVPASYSPPPAPSLAAPAASAECRRYPSPPVAAGPLPFPPLPAKPLAGPAATATAATAGLIRPNVLTCLRAWHSSLP